MARIQRLQGITFTEKVGQFNYYPPEDLLNVMSQISRNRPTYEKNAKVRAKKEAVYNTIFSKIRLSRFFTHNVSYCGLASVFFDRIFLLAYPLICTAHVFENDPSMIDAVKKQAQTITNQLSDFMNGVQFYGSDIFNVAEHQGNKYGIIDLDSNQLTSVSGCEDIYAMVKECAADECLVLIWNAMGMKKLTADEQREVIKERVVDRLGGEFWVEDEEYSYEDTSLMYVRTIKLRRRA